MTLLTAMTMLTYLDRLNLSIAGRNIQADYTFTDQTMGWIFSAFLLGYALFQIPGGWAGDRYGPRDVLTLTILSWSLLTAATGIAPRLPLSRWLGVAWSFAIVRFLIGVGEAAAMPNANKIVSNWMGLGHRGKGSAFTIAGIGAGGALTPPLIAWIMRRWGWRSSFYICGLIGIVFAVVWRLRVTNRPEEHRHINQSELELIRSGSSTPSPAAGLTPWATLLSSGSVWGLILGYFCQGYPIYFFHTWFFIYLTRVRGFTLTKGGWWGATPYLAMAMLAPLGGWFSDRAVSKIGKRAGRRLAAGLGMGGSAALIWIGSKSPNAPVAVILLALGCGFNAFSMPSFWATCIDLVPKHAGSLSGVMNAFGNLGGWLSPIMTAYVATRFGWNRALDCAAIVSLCSVLLWLPVDAAKPLGDVSVNAAVARASAAPASS
jgi:ACS family glucarate transporter-like MFS transporter